MKLNVKQFPKLGSLRVKKSLEINFFIKSSAARQPLSGAIKDTLTYLFKSQGTPLNRQIGIVSVGLCPMSIFTCSVIGSSINGSEVDTALLNATALLATWVCKGFSLNKLILIVQ